MVTNSNVARPSGDENDQVISKIPGAPRMDFTRSEAGHPVVGSAANLSQAGAKLFRITSRNERWCSGSSRL